MNLVRASNAQKLNEVSKIVEGTLRAQHLTQAALMEVINEILAPHDSYTFQAINLWATGKRLPGYWQMKHIMDTPFVGTQKLWLKGMAADILAVLRPDIWLPKG